MLVGAFGILIVLIVVILGVVMMMSSNPRQKGPIVVHNNVKDKGKKQTETPAIPPEIAKLSRSRCPSIRRGMRKR